MTGVTADSVSENSIDVSWNKATDDTGIEGYNVYLDDVKFNTSLVADTTYQITSLTFGEYKINIEAVDSAGNTGLMSTDLIVSIIDTVAPDQPVGLAYSALTSSSATVSWNASTDNQAIDGYNVYSNGTLQNTGLVSGLSYDLSGLTSSTLYKITIEAVDLDSNTTMSDTLTFTTLVNNILDIRQQDYKIYYNGSVIVCELVNGDELIQVVDMKGNTIMTERSNSTYHTIAIDKRGYYIVIIDQTEISRMILVF